MLLRDLRPLKTGDIRLVTIILEPSNHGIVPVALRLCTELVDEVMAHFTHRLMKVLCPAE
jgi:hypothetical protein